MGMLPAMPDARLVAVVAVLAALTVKPEAATYPGAAPTPPLASTDPTATSGSEVTVQVVLDVAQVRIAPVAGTAVGPSIVLLVVEGDAPSVHVPAPVALPKARVPVDVPGFPRVGVVVQADADVLVAPGIEPIAAAVAFVPPDAMARVADSPAAVPVVFWFHVGIDVAPVPPWFTGRADDKCVAVT
jgi:hypothetical protein